MSAVSSPVGGRDSGEFSILIASAGRLGTEPPGGVLPFRGQTAGAAGVGDAAVLLGTVLWEHPAVTRTVAAARAAKRVPRARKNLPFIDTGTSSCGSRALGFVCGPACAGTRLPTRGDPGLLG